MQTITGRLRELPPELDDALARYRYEIFIERLGWPLPCTDGMERDQFDLPDTLYALTRNADGSICGCGRLLPTTAPYLLGEVFPHMLPGECPPCSSEVWELSRFAATGTNPESIVDVAATTRSLLAAVVRTAIGQGAKRLITVSPPGVERLLLRLGAHAHRAGPPVLIDGARAIACWIELDRQTMDALLVDEEESTHASMQLHYAASLPETGRHVPERRAAY